MSETRCLFCGLVVVDGREVSGFTEGPDWMTVDGDFGCDDSPETSWDETDDDGGSGSHAVTEEEVRRAEGSDEAMRVAERRETKRLADKRVRDAAADLLATLEDLVRRCDGDEGVRADGSNIETRGAHAAIQKARGEA